jgi:hypothetical protein
MAPATAAAICRCPSRGSKPLKAVASGPESEKKASMLKASMLKAQCPMTNAGGQCLMLNEAQASFQPRTFDHSALSIVH